MTVLVIVLVLAAALFVAMKTGKVRDADGNNIPDVLEEKVAEVKEEVKEVVEKVKKATSKKPEAKKTNKKK
jgi:uncharacterized protein YycO